MILGDTPDFSLQLMSVWNILRVSILFHLWKTKNGIVFNGVVAMTSFSFADKCVIFFDAWLQIQSHVERINIDIKHLQHLFE